MKYTKARELISEAIEQIGEADGNPAPYGWNVKKSPSGRKRYVPKTKEQWNKESAKFHAKNPKHWERVKAFQKANPLNPDMDDHITGPDDHLPGGVGKKAREERRAAIKAHRRRIAEASNLRRHMSRATHRMASLLRRAGATPEEVRQGMTGKRTPAAKKGRALLAHAMKSAQKKASENMPNYPYGRKGLSEAKPPEDMFPWHPDNTDPRVSPSSKPWQIPEIPPQQTNPKPKPIPRPGVNNKPLFVKPLTPTDPDWYYGSPNPTFPPDLSGGRGRPNSVANRTRTKSVSEGMVKAVNKLKKRNFLASKGTAMRPSAFVSPAAHKAALVASAREKMK